MIIQSAAVWPSDSYSRCLAMQSANGVHNTTDFGPTGGAPPSRIYFDHAGADVPMINPGGFQRSFGVPPNSANVTNHPRQPFVIQWSDFAPCTSVRPVDGGTRPLLFIYITVASPSISSDTCRLRAGNHDPVALRGRYSYRGVAWDGGRDWADNPGGTGWKEAGNAFGPLFCLQYLTANPGIQVVLSGDSLVSGPTNDVYSTSVHRAAWDLSTPARPIEVANLAWWGGSWSVYGNLLLKNAAALRPSVVAYQPLSRNDGHGVEKLHLLLARSLMLADQMQILYGAKAIYNSAGCEPSWDGDAKAIEGFVDLRARLADIAEASGVPVIDGPSVLGPADAPWNYLPGLSNDNVHLNFAGAERVVPLARHALSQVIGPG
jgi:hypothetical protein